jgi:hypothetical protein
MLFDEHGRFLRRVGRSGSGPGEFDKPQDVVPLPGDSVLVLDVSRAQVFTSELREARRIILGRSLYPAVVLNWPSALVMAGDVGGQFLGRRRAHLVDLSGREAQLGVQLEYDDSAPRVPLPSAGFFQLANSPSASGIWSADPTVYRLVQWTREQGITRVLERRPSWFATRSEFWLGNATTPPPPRVAAIHEDESGLVWVYLLVTSPNWKQAWGRTSARDREVNQTNIDFQQLYQTMIEVIDPGQQRVVARLQVAEPLVNILPGNRAIFHNEDAQGETRVIIHKLTLVGR